MNRVLNSTEQSVSARYIVKFDSRLKRLTFYRAYFEVGTKAENIKMFINYANVCGAYTQRLQLTRSTEVFFFGTQRSELDTVFECVLYIL